MTDYIINIRNFLENNNIEYECDDDLSYFDGFDDVLVIEIKGETYKLLQNYENSSYKNITLYCDDGPIYNYDNIIKYYENKYKN